MPTVSEIFTLTDSEKAEMEADQKRIHDEDTAAMTVDADNTADADEPTAEENAEEEAELLQDAILESYTNAILDLQKTGTQDALEIEPEEGETCEAIIETVYDAAEIAGIAVNTTVSANRVYVRLEKAA